MATATEKRIPPKGGSGTAPPRSQRAKPKAPEVTPTDKPWPPPEEHPDELPIAKVDRFPYAIAHRLTLNGIVRIRHLKEKGPHATYEELHSLLEQTAGVREGLNITSAAQVLAAHLGIEVPTTPNEGEQLGESADNSETPTSETAEAPAEPPDVPPVATGALPPDDDPSTPENLAAYDAETVRESNRLNRECDLAEAEYEEANEHAKGLKKSYELSELALRKYLRDRADRRGKRPEKTLFDGVKEGHKTDADGWRDEPVTAGHFTVAMMTRFKDDEVETLGDVSAWIEEDPGILEEYPSMKEELDAAIGRWRRQQEASEPKGVDSADALSELWRDFPLTGWKEFGLTDSDVTKLAEGNVKRTGEVFPIRTVGDLNRFVTPNPAMPDFVRGYGDIKGIGQAGVDRISEAETKFWQAWNAGLKEKFAAERGLMPQEASRGDEGGSGDSEANPPGDMVEPAAAAEEQVPEPADAG